MTTINNINPMGSLNPTNSTNLELDDQILHAFDRMTEAYDDGDYPQMLFLAQALGQLITELLGRQLRGEYHAVI